MDVGVFWFGCSGYLKGENFQKGEISLSVSLIVFCVEQHSLGRVINHRSGEISCGVNFIDLENKQGCSRAFTKAHASAG